MNEKFYNLPSEKQQKIIDAGFRVFSENSYKKAPMSEIAAEAGISKSLLFHYFHNKKELYMFLWHRSCEITRQYMEEYKCYEPADLFEMMERGAHAKFEIMKLYPYMTDFTVKAFYEKDEEVRTEIQEDYQKQFNQKANGALAALNPDKFVPGLDIEMMYRDMYWAAEGYLWEMMQRGGLDAGQLEEQWEKLLAFWKNIYARKEEH